MGRLLAHGPPPPGEDEPYTGTTYHTAAGPTQNPSCVTALQFVCGGDALVVLRADGSLSVLGVSSRRTSDGNGNCDEGEVENDYIGASASVSVPLRLSRISVPRPAGAPPLPTTTLMQCAGDDAIFGVCKAGQLVEVFRVTTAATTVSATGEQLAVRGPIELIVIPLALAELRDFSDYETVPSKASREVELRGSGCVAQLAEVAQPPYSIAQGSKTDTRSLVASSVSWLCYYAIICNLASLTVTWWYSLCVPFTHSDAPHSQRQLASGECGGVSAVAHIPAAATRHSHRLQQCCCCTVFWCAQYARHTHDTAIPLPGREQSQCKWRQH